MATDAVWVAASQLHPVDQGSTALGRALGDAECSALLQIDPTTGRVLDGQISPESLSDLSPSPTTWCLVGGYVHCPVGDIRLTRKQFALLQVLVERSPDPVPASEILRLAWGYPSGPTAVVPVHIRRLREMLEAEPSHPTHLLTVRGVGYRFVP